MEAKANSTARDLRELAWLTARDEMNLAEFPITLLNDRVPAGVKTVEFHTANGKLTVTGSDDYGLPTALDADVIVALIQATKARNNFTDPTVYFTRYELLKLLGWPDKAEYYRRLDDSLQRWVGVTLRYDDSWWDNEIKMRVDASFHILESVVTIEPTVRQKLKARGQQGSLALSHFTWNRIFFKSCQANNLKQLDLTTYFSLKSAISKQMYRFLDKRFYKTSQWVFDLEEFAQGHVGISPNYTPAKIKEKLQPSLEELEAIGFLEEESREERYTRLSRGKWTITLKRKAQSVPSLPMEAPEPLPGSEEQALVARGITPAVATDLAAIFSPEAIRDQIERFDWLVQKKDKRVSKNPAGFLAEAVRKSYAAPKGFESQREQEARIAAQRERDRLAAEKKRQVEAAQKAQESAERLRIDTYFNSLTEGEKEALQAEALKHSGQFLHNLYRRAEPGSVEAKRYLQMIMDTRISDLLTANPPENS